ncbi:GCRV-induced gene 2o [Chanos chanos]|uniref:GCRV-induced gene 2o n=1 Tax=Chanos chanos TaxID=29144 RepID=A0A6J2WX99_CHACN|nr:uncharacterized protein LOC115828839 [Chanos chanos]
MSNVVIFSGWKSYEDRKALASGQRPESGGVYTMYHGTHLKSARDIISNGFKPSADGLLGRGVYVSRNIEKAKCYPLQTDKKDSVVFKLKVRVGRVKKINSDTHPLQKSWHQNGYDCAWVPPKSNISSIKSGREEDCVWDPKRITVIDVACCVDDAKRAELRRLIRRRRKGEGQCDLCHQSGVPHDTRRCWECGDFICCFQAKHICKRD